MNKRRSACAAVAAFIAVASIAPLELPIRLLEGMIVGLNVFLACWDVENGA